MKKRNNIIAIIFIFVTMVLMSMSDNVRGAFIPAFKEDFSANNTQMGVMLSICSLGYILFTYIGGILCERIGQKKVILIGIISSSASLIGLYFTPNYAGLLLGLFILNAGISLIGIGINTLIPILMFSFPAVLMNITHFCYGVGATATQRTAGILLYKGITWRQIYLTIGALFLIALFSFLFVKIPRSVKVNSVDKIRNKDIFSNKLVYFYMIALGLYVAAEIGTGNWFVTYLQEVYNYNESLSTFYPALFFGIFTFGRLIGGFVAERFGHLRSVVISLTSAFILYSLGLFMGEKGIIIISISGLFFAITFPTIVLNISMVFKKSSAYITGIIITIASTINMIINFIIGGLNDLIGVYKTFYIIPICLLLSIIFTYLIYINTKDTLAHDN